MQSLFVKSQLPAAMVADNIRVRPRIEAEVKIKVKLNRKFTVKDISSEDIMVNNIKVKGTVLKDKQAEGRQVIHNLVQANYR